MFLGVTGMLSLMPYTDADLRRLADIVRRERIDKQLDKEPAARAAGVSSITWKRVEDAEGVRDASLSKILTSLGLADADSLLAGGEAHPQIRKANYEPAPFPYDRAALVQELTDIWEAWRDLGLQLVAGPDPDLSRQARRGLSLTATVLLNLLTLTGSADSSALRADLTAVMFKVFKPEEKEGEKDDLETEASSGASGEAHQKQEVRPEPPSTIETALGDHWAEAVDWSTIRTPADVQRLVLELAEEALKMHGQVDLDLNDFAAKIRNYADALRRDQDAEQGDEVEEVRVDTAWRVTEEPKSPPPVWDGHYRTMVGLLTTLASIDPALDFLPEFEQLTRAIEPSLDTPMGMRQYIVSTKDILGRARDKLQLYSDDPEQMRTIDEMIARVEEHANAASVAAGAGSVSQLRPAHWDQSPPPPPTTAKAASKGYKQSDDERDDTE